MSKGENNLTAKIFALIIAIVLWSYVMSVENPDITNEYKNISVNLHNTSYLDRRGLVIMEPKEVKISVKVRGKKSEMDRFSSSNIAAEIDLIGYDEGQVRAPVRVNLLNNLSGVEIVNWEPKEILFTLDKIITKEKTVRVQVDGNLGDDYVLGEITSKPEKILIRGPRTWVNEVAEVKAVVDITDKDVGMNITVPIQISDDKGNEVRGLEKEPAVVEVNIPVLRKHTLPIKLQTEGELPEGYVISDITINPSSVVVKGNDNILNLTHINTKPVDVNDLVGRTSMEVELDLSGGVELLNPNEKIIINYAIEEVSTSDFIYNLDDLEIRNLSEDLYIEEQSINNIIQVTIKGTQADLGKVAKEDIKLYLDFESLEEGFHEMKVQTETIPGITIEAITPETIRLKLNPREVG